ncbi:hypothetical protein [Embleya sp. NPDC050493]|uniref:hypothetical protein n=1 Tax=Embleya sp. NPDC050493 TaxID=3363989 RepID=UPI0037A0F711
MGVRGLEVSIRQGAEGVDVPRFTTSLNHMISALTDIDGAYLARGVRPQWIVNDLRSDSTHLIARVSAREHLERSMSDMLFPIQALVDGVNHLADNPEVPPYYIDQAVRHVIRAGTPGQGVQEVSVALFNGRVGPAAVLSEAVRANGTAAVRRRRRVHGSVTGVLDIANLRHKSRMRISIFDKTTRRAVSGVIPTEADEDLRAQARAALGSRVRVGGIITRNDRGQAISIQVERLRVLPDSGAQRPIADELLGVDPDWLGGISVDEWLYEVRGG